MVVTVNWGTKVVTVPKAEMLLIQSNPVEVRQLDLTEFRYALHDVQDNEAGIVHDRIHSHNFAVNVSGVVLAQVVEIINDYTITFEDGLYNVNIVGGNSNVSDRVNKNQVGVNTANSAGLQDSSSLQAASFGGVIALDQINGTDGTVFPIGTKGTPVKTVADARLIMAKNNIDTMYVIGNGTFGLGDDISNIVVIGQNPTKTVITIDTLAQTVGTEIKLCAVTGVLDGGSVLRECLIDTINYVNGFLVDCVLGIGTITLGGNANALFMRCVSGVPGLLTPTVDMGGAGQSLGLRDYNGGIKIINKTGDDPFSLDVASGQVILDSTVTNGTLVCRGVGKLKDFSTGTALVINEMVNGAEVANIQRLVELQGNGHSALGKVWYWDPYSGSDLNEGDHISRGVKTFAKAHELAVSGRSDLIIAMSTDPSGTTVTNENIVISKDDVMLRGQGESFEIRSADDNLDGISITGHGCEVSSMSLGTSATSIKHCIYIANSNSLVKDVVLNDAVDGILVESGEYNVLKNIKAHHNLGTAIEVGGTAQHTDILDCHIGGNGVDGILLSATTPHEVVIGGDTVIHKNTRYGINISSSMTNVTIGSNVSVFLNTTGDINDLGTDTYHAEVALKSDVLNATQI